MAAVAKVGTPTATTFTVVNGTNTATNTFSGTQPRTAGHLLLMVVQATATTSITTPTTPTGWAPLLAFKNGTTLPCGVWIFSKTAAGSDAAPSSSVVTSGTSRVGCTLIELSGVNTTTPVDTSGTNTNGTTGQALTTMTATTAAVVQAGVSGFALGIFTRFLSSAATMTYTPDTGWTALEGDAATSTRGHMFIDFLTAAPPAGSALTETPVTSSNTVVYAAAVVAFAPAALTLSDADTGSGTDAGETVNPVTADTGTGLDAGSVAAGGQAVSDADTGSGADAGSVAAALSDSDTGHGADAQALAAALSDSDAAAGAAADAQTLAVTLPGSDTGSGADSGAVTGLTQPELLRARPGPAWITRFQPGRPQHNQVIPLWGNPVAVSADTGSGLDAGEKLALADSDAGSGADAQSVAAALPGSDTGSGLDAGEKLSPSSADAGSAADAGEKLAPSSSDTGTGADAGEKLSPSSSDAGSGADAGSANATLAGADTGSGVDAGEKVNPVTADTGSAAETPVLAVSDADTGHGADAGTVLAAVPGADTGTGADAGEKLALAAAETGAGADTGVLTALWGQDPVRAQPGPAWLARFRPWSPRRVIALPAPARPPGTPVTDSDAFTGADAQVLAAALPDSDAGSAAETQILALADSDTGTAADGGEQARQPGADVFSAADGGELLVLASADTASAADTAQTLALADDDTGSAADDGQVSAALADDDTGSSIEAATAGTGGHPVADGDTGTGHDAGSPLFATFLLVTTEIAGPDVVIAVGGPELGITILDPHGNAVS